MVSLLSSPLRWGAVLLWSFFSKALTGVSLSVQSMGTYQAKQTIACGFVWALFGWFSRLGEPRVSLGCSRDGL